MFRWILLTSFFLYSSATSIAQSDTVNQVDEDGRKQGHWIYYGKDRPEAGFPADGKIEEGPYLDDRKHGYWYKYHRDGITPKLKGNYERNRPNGKYWKYYEDGTRKEEGEWTKNRYVGLHVRYFRNGNMESCEQYNEEGKRIGNSYFYFQNGCRERVNEYDSTGGFVKSLIYSADSCDIITDTISPPISDCGYRPTTNGPGTKKNNIGKKTYTWRYMTEYLEEYSDSSICNSISETGRCYNKDRELFFRGICKDGKVLQGSMYFYDKDGILMKVELWKNGEYLKDGVL